MEPIRKAYCRSFQRIMWLTIPLLPYRKPTIVESVEALAPYIKEQGCSRVLIVTDPGVSERGLTDGLEAALKALGIHVAMYDKTAANPTTDTVEEAFEQYRRERCDAIIGVGGGSSMDCAKAVGIRVAKPNTPLSKLGGILKVRRRLPLLAAVPTTAGTGSETTLAAVIVDAKTRHKYAINDFPLIPRCAVLEPRITVSLPPALTASTGLDALTHAVEAYIGGSTTADTRADALAAVELIFGNIDRAYRDGNDLEARRNMLTASFRAGCAFTKSYVGYVHAVAHSLGGAYNIPHGYANAVILPKMLRVYEPKITGKLAALSRAAGVADASVDETSAGRAFITAIEDMKRRFEIPDTFPELRREDIPKLAACADREANPLYPVPLLMDAGELAQFYEQLLEEGK